MKARIIDQPARVFSQPDLNPSAFTELPVGSEIDLGAVRNHSGRNWVVATLSNGQQGYLPGKTPVFHIKPATLLQDGVKLYAEPSAQSAVKTTYAKNKRLFLVSNVQQDKQAWVKVRDDYGTEGFIDGQTRIKEIPESNKAVAQKMILYGFLWCAGGIVVTVVSYTVASSSSSGGSYVVAWGAVLFGGWQMIKGLYKFLTESS